MKVSQRGFSPIIIILVVVGVVILTVGFIFVSGFISKNKTGSSAYSSYPSASLKISGEDLYKNISVAYKKYYPLNAGDLRLVQLEKGDYGTGQRGVQTKDGVKPVSIAEAYRGFYAYPGSEFFIKMHVERSKIDSFQQDLVAVKGESDSIAGQKGVSLKESEYKGVKYLSTSRDKLGDGMVIGQSVFNIPSEYVIVTIYFTNQGIKNKTTSIDEYHKISDDFVHSIIDSISYK